MLLPLKYKVDISLVSGVESSVGNIHEQEMMIFIFMQIVHATVIMSF